MAKSEFQQFKDTTKAAHVAAKEFLKTGRMPEGEFNNAKATMSVQSDDMSMDGPINSPIAKPIPFHQEEGAKSRPAPPRASSPDAAIPVTTKQEGTTQATSSEEESLASPRLVKAKIGDVEVEVSEEKFNELKSDGLLETKAPTMSDEDRQMIEAARFMDTQFRQIPGLKDFVLKSIRSGRVPDIEEFRPKESVPHGTDDLEDDGSLDDSTKKAVNLALSRMESKFEPLIRSLAEREERDKAERENKLKQDFITKIHSVIDEEMKSYPVLSRANYAKLARERVVDRLRDDPRADIRILVAQTASMFTDEKKAELKEKVERSKSNQGFVTPSGEGHSPTIGPKKEFTWEDFRKGKLKSEVGRILDEARRGSI